MESIVFLQGEYKIKTTYDGLASLNKVGMNDKDIKISRKHIDMVSMISDL